MRFTINLGVHPNIEVAEDQIILKGNWESVKFIFDQYAEAGSAFNWIIIRDNHNDYSSPKLVMRWIAGEGIVDDNRRRCNL